MITFTDQLNLAQEISGLSDASSVVRFKRDINQGGMMFAALLGRTYNQQRRFTDSVSEQQYYQYPEDAQKITEVVYHSSNTFNPPLEQIADQHTWLLLNQNQLLGEPSHYYVRGFDEIGLYPTPNQDIDSGIEILFEPRHTLLTEADYTTGTITLTNGSATVTGLGTVFTAAMAGRYLQVTDGTDGNYYRISSYTNGTTLTLENVYQGLSGGSKTYRIGQVMNLPDEFLEAPVDYAMYRHYLAAGDKNTADNFKDLFNSSKDMAREKYGQTTSNNVISAAGHTKMYDPLRDTPRDF